MRISDWSSDVCSSDLLYLGVQWFSTALLLLLFGLAWTALLGLGYRWHQPEKLPVAQVLPLIALSFFIALALQWYPLGGSRSEEHTSELQSLMRISYAVFCLKKKKISTKQQDTITES